MLHCFTVDCIFPVSSPPLKNGTLVAKENGEIVALHPQHSFDPANYKDELHVERRKGILCPGFINAHCHMELSHMNGKLEQKKSLPEFIEGMIKGRSAEKKIITEAIHQAEIEMMDGGIVGVGDICNTSDTLEIKKLKRLHYHNFIELFDLIPENASKEFEKGLSLLEDFKSTATTSSLVPHAPYTVTTALLKYIHDWSYAHDGLLSIHNQETESENEMFVRGQGALFAKLSSFGALYKNWKPTGFSSISSVLTHLPKCNKTLLVHNTYSTQEDINWAQLYSPVIHWCLCPNANLYIENRLPDIQLFADNSCRMLIGTDSYASNTALSVLEELKTISKHFPKIKLDQLLQWATLNGAAFFGWQKELGSFEAGKKPGINLITDVDTSTFSLTDSSQVIPLLKPSVVSAV